MTAHRKPLYGVGINDWDSPVKVDGKPIWNYRVWQSMLQRCYSEEFKKARPTYLNTTCDSRWLSLKNFTEDITQVENFNMLDEGWALDKDIVGGINHYNIETVCIVPVSINNLLISHESCRGEYPIGVSYDKNRCKYLSSMKRDGKTVNLGRFDTVEGASLAYNVAKELHVKEIAERYRNILSATVYEKLLLFKV